MTRPTRSIHRLYGESGIGLKSKSYWTAGDAFWVFPAILYRYWTEPVRGTILIWGFFGLWPISNIRNEREAWSRNYYLQISSWEIWYCPSWWSSFCWCWWGLSDTFIVSQCMGAGDIEQAEQYFKRLMKSSLVIALAMCMDWLSRAVVFWVRFRRGKWKTFHVISWPWNGKFVWNGTENVC